MTIERLRHEVLLQIMRDIKLCDFQQVLELIKQVPEGELYEYLPNKGEDIDTTVEPKSFYDK